MPKAVHVSLQQWMNQAKKHDWMVPACIYHRDPDPMPNGGWGRKERQESRQIHITALCLLMWPKKELVSATKMLGTELLMNRYWMCGLGLRDHWSGRVSFGEKVSKYSMCLVALRGSVCSHQGLTIMWSWRNLLLVPQELSADILIFSGSLVKMVWSSLHAA